MKLKALNRSANHCWSPEEIHSGIYVAAGTTAQQVDASFSTSSQLEVLSLDVASPDKALKPLASTQCDQRFHRLVWCPLGIQQGSTSMGIVCGGTDNGSVQVYDVQRLLNGDNPLLSNYKNHSGPVHALDFNPFQHNLLASGSRESEIYIWDLSSTTAQPYSPGASSQPLEDVACLAWNRQVQHILASAMPSRCVVWDLRKSEPIIRVSDTTSRFRCKAVAWNPQVATQLCLASEDDHAPWLQIWDLRYASSPVKTLEKHQKGVLSLNWHPKDQDMLVSCGKGSSVCIWNPNGTQGSELISELTSTSDWNFEVQWCPRNPALVSLASFTGEVAVYSVIGGEHQGGAGDVLKKAPSWLGGSVGAQFGFGGKLVTFSKDLGAKVDVAQVVTDEEFITRVNAMEDALFRQAQKPAEAEAFWIQRFGEADGVLWQYLRALQEADPNTKLQELLGYSAENLRLNEPDDLSSAFDSALNVNGAAVSDAASAERIAKVVIAGDIGRAAELCMKGRRFAEALFLADYARDAGLKEMIRKEFLNSNRANSLCRLVACVSSGLWEELADLAPISEWKSVLAACLRHVTDGERMAHVCSRVGVKLANEGQKESALLAYAVGRDIVNLAECYLAIHGDPTGSPARLQKFIEVVTAIKQLTGVYQLPKELAGKVAEYVELLSDQGCLSTALHYLNDLDTTELRVAQLRDRILQSQGMTAVGQFASQNNQFSLQSANRRNRTLSSTSSFEAPRSAFQPLSNFDYNSNVFAPMSPGHEFHQTPAAPPMVPPPSTGASDTPRPLSRAGKYPAVVDPSIKNSGPSYGNYGAPFGAPDPYAASGIYQQPLRNAQFPQHPYSTDGFGAGGQPLSPGPMVPGPPQSLPPTGYPNSSIAARGTPQPQVDLPNGNEYTRDRRYSAPGWNDPPPVRRSSKPVIAPPSIPEGSPLTTPLPGVPAPMPETTFICGTQPAVQAFTPQMPQQYQYAAPAPRQPTPPIEKGPIPAEYQPLYDTFESLRIACQTSIQDTLALKKLDEVHRKIEALADKFRQHGLSDATLQNIRLIADAVAQRDYNNALQMFGYVAQTSNMSETSAFLPGIKTLLVIAQQNQVYA